jgi:hypothetical protein
MRALGDHLEHASQQLRDPGLTQIGLQMAELYGPVLQQRLVAVGFDIARLVVGASALRRAKETAALLFPGQVVQIMPHLTEHGAIPENTPRAGLAGHKPDWTEFIRYLCETIPKDQKECHLAVVGHGGYLRTEVWSALTGRSKPTMGNLDAFIVEGDLDLATGRLLHRHVTEIPYMERIIGQDRCVVTEDNRHVEHHTRKIATSHRMAHRHRHTNRCSHRRSLRNQKGGATPMPLAYYQPGAYETRTPEATGVGIAGSTDAWVRTPVSQMGGRRQKQAGGFNPTIMGQFASAGLRLIPVAGYMGYKMFNKKGSRKSRKSRKTRRSR